MDKLALLIRRLNKARGEYHGCISDIEILISNETGLEIESNDFPGDDLGIAERGTFGNVHIDVNSLLEIHKKNGKLTADDIRNGLHSL